MRSLKDLLALADDLRDRGVGLVVIKQAIDTTSPQGRLVFHLLGALDEFQRELIVEGTNEGLAAARARGRVGGRKPKLAAGQVKQARLMYEDGGHTVADIAAARRQPPDHLPCARARSGDARDIVIGRLTGGSVIGRRRG